MELLAWWNLPFVLPFSGALLYLIFLAFGGVPEAGHDVDADVDAEVDVDHDLDLDHDADVDHGVEHYVGGHEHEMGPAESHHSSNLAQALSFLGIGRVPLSMIFMSFAFVWGFTGWAANKFFSGVLQFPMLYFWPSLGVAALSSVLGTRYLARGIAKFMPSTESYASSNSELVGKRAEVRYQLTAGSGSVLVRDKYGNLLELSCRIKSGDSLIPAGSSVVLMDYDESEKVFVARQDPLKRHELSSPSQPPVERR